ncbi:hypothetical protein [Eubacterium oxidoreducens]|uniref:SynChlorMet cassette protein ScmC n=1 Tax=Eubacterium oxidoreducens TaxID=1732 RepID=A0A1G6CQN6_EUBOX|nr:hypothetical protein [Eubacterium oxidoreducens]SDB35154.1 hypothetical protein SAMN02910417_02587 [Eubacterium oxidoreducens]
MDKVFQIGDFVFRLIIDDEIPVPENFMLFESKRQQEPVYTYEVKVVYKLENITGKVLAKREDLTVYENEAGESRLLGIKYTDKQYALYTETTSNHAVVQVIKSQIEGFRLDTAFASLLALERRMYAYDSMVLHCAYVEYENNAILFSAPSGVGKSTQANLWEQYKGAKTINGDRALLSKRDERWIAQGWPICGSSQICYNKEMDIATIVMLYQAQENVVRRLRPVEAFKKLYAQITVNGWNSNQGAKCIALLEQLVQEVPVYELGCDISKEAVEVLDKGIKQDEL